MSNLRNIGTKGENLAEQYLRKKSYKILCKNFRTPFGEIDIIAKHGETIVFVEVKLRKTKRYGTPEEAITSYKKRHIIKSAFFYLKRYSLFEISIRFDVIAISPSAITHYENAFDADDSFF